MKIYIIFSGVYTAAMGFTSDVCWFLLMKTLLIKNNKKREAALKIEAGGDEKHVFFFYLALTREKYFGALLLFHESPLKL